MKMLGLWELSSLCFGCDRPFCILTQGSAPAAHSS